MASVIQVRDVSKVYPASGAPALYRITLDIRPGEVTLLMGPSGSGKTTLISIMGAILRPTSGHIGIAGNDVSRLSEKQLPAVRRRHIGFIFQSFNLMPTLSVSENVELSLELKGIRGRKARRVIAHQLLADVGLTDKLDALPANLSGGQKQRVAIARALAGNPDIVLADEPTAALDSVSGRIVMEKLRSLAAQGRAVLIVTHDNRILEYANRIIQIEDGRITSDSSAAEELELVVAQKGRRAPQMAKESTQKMSFKFGGSRFYRLLTIALIVLANIWFAVEFFGFKRIEIPAMAAHANTAAADSNSDSNARPSFVSGAGQVEPASEELKISSSVAGRLVDLPVSEGQQLSAGQIIAVLDGGDLAARVAQAEANVELRQAELDRLINGSSTFERQAAVAAADEAKIQLENATADMAQHKALFEAGVTSRSELDKSEREVRMAQLRLDKALVSSASLDSPAREDDGARSRASLRAAREQLTEARALLSEKVIRAPFSGVVLKCHHRVGEEVGLGDAIVSFGDISHLVVRVDVDEADVAKIQLGQRAYVTAQAFGPKRFTGTVSHIGGQLGRKNIDTGDPQVKVDTKVLETLVFLDGHPTLPIGLRVDAFILTKTRSHD